MGFTDNVIAAYTGCDTEDIIRMRNEKGIKASFRTVDTCTKEFEAVSPYYYSTYGQGRKTTDSRQKKILVIGSDLYV